MTNKNISKYQHGFTLAEVLITLTIIGVIAALTIPNLMVKHEKQVTVTKLKKVYSTLSQAVDTSIAENGPISSWNIPAYGDDIDVKHDFLKKYIFNYLKVAKDCGHNKCTNGYLKQPLNNNYDISSRHWYPYANTFILEDGTYIYAQWRSIINVHQCSIFVDINNEAKPNVFGKDVFVFNFDENNKIIPADINSSRDYLIGANNYTCNINAWSPGVHCAGLIMKDGWKISDDYPW